MASLDVEPLFTKMPLNETINNCISDQHKNLYNGQLGNRNLFKLLETAPSESSFIFKQVDRLAMDSPLVNSLTNAYLCLYEKKTVG